VKRFGDGLALGTASEAAYDTDWTVIPLSRRMRSQIRNYRFLLWMDVRSASREMSSAKPIGWNVLWKKSASRQTEGPRRANDQSPVISRTSGALDLTDRSTVAYKVSDEAALLIFTQGPGSPPR
jgi:hypothetical protein